MQSSSFKIACKNFSYLPKYRDVFPTLVLYFGGLGLLKESPQSAALNPFRRISPASSRSLVHAASLSSQFTQSLCLVNLLSEFAKLGSA